MAHPHLPASMTEPVSFDGDIDETSEPKRYLTWGPERGWQVCTASSIGTEIEDAHYSGVLAATKFFLLDDERGEQYPTTLAFLDSRQDDNDYSYSRYRIGDEEFTVRIDLRA